jgi:hypothetical protein
MGGYKIDVDNDLLPGLMNEGNGLGKPDEMALNQVLEAQMSEYPAAGPSRKHCDVPEMSLTKRMP